MDRQTRQADRCGHKGNLSWELVHTMMEPGSPMPVFCAVKPGEQSCESGSEGLRPRGADGVNPSVGAGDDGVPAQAVRQRKQANSFFSTSSPLQAFNSLDEAHPGESNPFPESPDSNVPPAAHCIPTDTPRNTPGVSQAPQPHPSR